MCQAVAGRHLAAVCGGWHSSSDAADPARCWHGLPPPCRIYPSIGKESLALCIGEVQVESKASFSARSWPTSSHAFGAAFVIDAAAARGSGRKFATDERSLAAPPLAPSLPPSLGPYPPPFECL